MPRWFGARIRYLVLAVATIALGLAVYRRGGALSPAVRDVLGDALWAAMVAWLIATVAPAIGLPLRAAVAVAFCFAVELSQLYHTPAIDAIRQTTAGHLVLGSGFDPRDFAAYAAGVLGAVLLDRTIEGRCAQNRVSKIKLWCDRPRAGTADSGRRPGSVEEPEQ